MRYGILGLIFIVVNSYSCNSMESNHNVEDEFSDNLKTERRNENSYEIVMDSSIYALLNQARVIDFEVYVKNCDLKKGVIQEVYSLPLMTPRQEMPQLFNNTYQVLQENDETSGYVQSCSFFNKDSQIEELKLYFYYLEDDNFVLVPFKKNNSVSNNLFILDLVANRMYYFDFYGKSDLSSVNEIIEVDISMKPLYGIKLHRGYSEYKSKFSYNSSGKYIGEYSKSIDYNLSDKITFEELSNYFDTTDYSTLLTKYFNYTYPINMWGNHDIYPEPNQK